MKKYLRPISYIGLVILVVLGSFHCFNTGNLLMSDVANYENAFNFPYIFTTFAHLPLSLTFILLMFFLVRFYALEPQYRVHMIKSYSKIAIGFGLAGTLFSILSGAVAYHSFVVPYPYAGAPIVALILNIIVLCGATCLYVYLRVKKLPDEKKPYKKKHIGRTILMSLLAFIAFNRFGALLAMGWYTEWHYLYLTIWFYLTLPLPLLTLLLFALFRMRVFTKSNVNFALVASTALFLVSLTFCLVLMVIGMNEPLLVSLISPAMPLERLATIPVDFILIFLSTVGPTLTTMIFEIYKIIKRNKQLSQK